MRPIFCVGKNPVDPDPAAVSGPWWVFGLVWFLCVVIVPHLLRAIIGFRSSNWIEKQQAVNTVVNYHFLIHAYLHKTAWAHISKKSERLTGTFLFTIHTKVCLPAKWDFNGFCLEVCRWRCKNIWGQKLSWLFCILFSVHMSFLAMFCRETA